MKKTIYSAVLGALLTVSATQALAVDLGFSGAIREYLEIDNINGGTNHNTDKPGLKLTNFTSKFTVTAVEPLNDVSPGLKFNAKVATEFFADNPTNNTTYEAPPYRQNQIGNNISTVGFSNDWFKLDFGRKGHMLWWTVADFDAMDDFQGTAIGEVHTRQGLRFNNGIFADVKLTSAIKLTYETELSENASVTNPYDAGITYKEGNIEARYVHFDKGDGRNESDVIAGSYMFPTHTQVMLMASADKKSNVDYKGYSVSVKQRINDKWSARAMYGHRDDGVNAYTAGVDYQMTKSLALVGRFNYTEADRQIYMTIPNDFAGAMGTSRLNASAGVEFYF